MWAARSGITTAAALANAFAGDYLTALIDVPAVPAAVVFIILLTLINLRGVRESLAANLIASVIEVTGLVIVIVVAAIVLASGNGEPARLLEFAPDVPPLEGASAASIVAFFSFLGFEAAANMAEEVRNPSKAYPRALFGAICTAGVVYLLIALGAVIVMPPEDLAESTGPLLDVVAASGVNIPPGLFSIIALIAIANGALLFMVMASRVGYGLAEAELLPGPSAAYCLAVERPKRRLIASYPAGVMLASGYEDAERMTGRIDVNVQRLVRVVRTIETELCPQRQCPGVLMLECL